MRRHTLGFLVFSFIIGSAAIIYASFSAMTTENTSVTALPERYSSRTSCWNMKRQARESKISMPIIRQATLSAEGSLFIFEIGCVEKPKQISLYFYSKNERNTKLIAVEEIDLKPSAACDNLSLLYRNFTWANELNRGENIYVIARDSNQDDADSTEFDESLATPVSMASRGISF